MIKHFSAGGILLNSNKEIFMIKKTSRAEWLLPKGTIEEGESPLDTATREVKEETGYKNIKPLDKKPFAETQYKMTHPKTGDEVLKTVNLYRFELIDDTFEKTPEMKAEGLEGKWLSIEEVIKITKFKDLKEILKKLVL